MGMLYVIRGKYENENVIENVIRYVTRSSVRENRRSNLIAYGGLGVRTFGSIEDIIFQMQIVQEIFNIKGRKGKRLLHETFNIMDIEFEEMGKDFGKVYALAYDCCQYYYSLGHQVVFAVHYEQDKRVHIHFVVNTINFFNGLKFHNFISDAQRREHTFNQNMKHYQMLALQDKEQRAVCPIYWFR